MPWSCLHTTFLTAAWPNLLAFFQCPLPHFPFYWVSVPSSKPWFNPNSSSLPLGCSCQNPPTSSISPSALAFSREVIHGIALPQASSSAKIPQEHGGMAGVSRGTRAKSRHTLWAGSSAMQVKDTCGKGEQLLVFQLPVWLQLWFMLIWMALLSSLVELCLF